MVLSSTWSASPLVGWRELRPEKLDEALAELPHLRRRAVLSIKQPVRDETAAHEQACTLTGMWGGGAYDCS